MNLDQQESDWKLISRVLEYLDGGDLKAARLVNDKFNQIITSNPRLFWAKNMMTIRKPTMDSAWNQLRRHKLISIYKCPNFHFLKTNLLLPGCTAFFQGTVRYQVKHLKLTGCLMTTPVLLCLLEYCSVTLEHLEIEDFSRLEGYNEDSEEAAISLQSLKTLILDNRHGTEGSLNSMTRHFLENVLIGTRNLGRIEFLGWGARPCKKFVQIVGTMFHENLLQVRILKIVCEVEDSLTTLQQYSFLKDVDLLCFPNLKKFTLQFDGQVKPSEGLTAQVIDMFTERVAAMIEGASLTLEEIQLVNCPLTNAIFRKGTNYFPKLRRLNTRGTLITQLDEDANPIYESGSDGSTCARKIMGDSGDSGSGDEEEKTFLSNSNSRLNTYKIVCLTIFCCVTLHYVVFRIFPLNTAVKLEGLIHAALAALLVKGKDLMEKSRTLDRNLKRPE